MKKLSLHWRNIVLLALLIMSPAGFAGEISPVASFAEFANRAREGETMVVVFFGGSLTWGEGASDPERTSYRALLENYFKDKYPKSHFIFHDSAIAGAGSKLGMFRVDGDVLAHHPDLVFIDFTIEDKLNGTDREALASYERVLVDLISSGVPVVQVLAATKGEFGADWTHLGPQRFRDHLEMGKLYHAAIGNSLPVIQGYLKKAQHDRQQIWPGDQTEPNDLGHRFIYESVRDGLEQAIREKRISRLPAEPVFAGEYRNRFQFFPANGVLPTGWRAAKSLQPTLKVVETANAWKGQVAVADADTRDIVKPIQLSFNGTFLGILGEADEHGAGFKVLLDGHPVPYREKPVDEIWPTSTASTGGGERFFWREISDKLEPGRHTVEVLPVFSDDATKSALRIESICVAGPEAKDVQNLTLGRIDY